jgi:hypothetical protein
MEKEGENMGKIGRNGKNHRKKFDEDRGNPMAKNYMK